MTQKQWEKLYYPVPASAACSTALEAAEHSLRKWRGIANEEMLGFDCSETCALCQFSKPSKMFAPECSICPLVLSGHEPCEYRGSPWRKWANGDGDASDMINALEETVEWCKQQESLDAMSIKEGP